MTSRLRVSDRFLYFVLLWCIFSFKVILVGWGDTGVRVDDLLILLASLVLFGRGDIFRIPRSSGVKAYLIFVVISFCSAVWNVWVGRVELLNSALFVIRLLQYLSFYYIGYALVESGIQVWRGLRIYFWMLCVLVPLQMVRLIPVASRFDASRASGNTNGPYELATVAVFFLCYFGYRERKKLGAASALIILFLTASRITCVATLLSFAKRAIEASKSKLRMATAAVLVASLLWGVGVWISSMADADSDTGLASRLHSLLSGSVTAGEMWEVYAAVPTYRTATDFADGAVNHWALGFGMQSGSDVSAMARIVRWLALIKSTLSHFDSIVLGMGPAFAWVAVDGQYVRIFVETGLLGLLAFFCFLKAVTKPQADPSGAFREYVLIVALSACFIDTFTSYKTMMLLWLWHGMNEFQARKGDDSSSLSHAS
ncbi:MAG: hypothetical protein ABSB60_07110 [Terracidiphilus sp.]|jgi:hypothetical protein